MKLLAPINYQLLTSNVAPSTYGAWSGATSYLVGNRVVYTDRREYEAKTANTNKIPTDNSSDWLLLGAENRLKMFDQYVHTRTVNNNSIQVSLSTDGLNGLYLGNIAGNDIAIDIFRKSDNVLLERVNKDLFLIDDWYDYFCDVDIFTSRTNEFIYERTTTDPLVTTFVTILGEVCELGQLFVGKHKELGCTQWEPVATLLDYSKKTTDLETGETYLLKGKSVKKVDYTVFIPTLQSQKSFKWLQDNSGIPCVFYHSNEYEILTNYGYIQDVSVTLKGVIETIISIKTEGLI